MSCDEVGDVLGYVAGRVQPDGDGYIDFLAVAPGRRQQGVGRALVTALSRQLVEGSPNERVCLTVRDSNHPARALYEQLGFRVDASIAPFEAPPGWRTTADR